MYPDKGEVYLCRSGVFRENLVIRVLECLTGVCAARLTVPLLCYEAPTLWKGFARAKKSPSP